MEKRVLAESIMVDRTVKNTKDAMELLKRGKLTASPTPYQTLKNAKVAMELLKGVR